MGQVQSEPATVAVDAASSFSATKNRAAATGGSSETSIDSLIAEAAAYGDSEGESIDAKAQKALECPCIADLRTGSCGTQFSEAFLCFLKSTAEEKGSDCVHPFVALQSCIRANPNAFSKDILEDEDNKVKEEEEPKKEYKIIPPKWSRESPSPKSKLPLKMQYTPSHFAATLLDTIFHCIAEDLTTQEPLIVLV